MVIARRESQKDAVLDVEGSLEGPVDGPLVGSAMVSALEVETILARWGPWVQCTKAAARMRLRSLWKQDLDESAMEKAGTGNRLLFASSELQLIRG